MSGAPARLLQPAAPAGAPETAGGILTIDLRALASNWRMLRTQAGEATCAAVVKADAYGIGTEPAVLALWAAGCQTFFVAHLSEAARVRAAAPEATIYVLNGLLPGTAPAYVESHLRPVLGSMDEVRDWSTFSQSSHRRLPAAIHVDTGMNRLGLSMVEATALAADLIMLAFEPALLMSHLVTSETPDDPLNGCQIEAFQRLRASFPGVPASLANSSGIFLPEKPHFDLVRPGYALYGGNPTPGRANPMQAVVSLQARVIQVREAEGGAGVGYNAQWTTSGPRRLATLSVGYADGFPRAASGTDRKRDDGALAGEAIVAGHQCPFAGRVSMDLIVVDVTGVPEGEVRRGDLVTLIGGDLDIDEVGRRAGTIGYEILTALGRRYHRVYLGA